MAGTCIFRVDALPFMGVGHLSRCLALASALRASGGQVHFICRDGENNANWLVEKQAFPLHCLPAGRMPATPEDTQQWLGCGVDEDAAATHEIVRSLGGADWLIVDHYALDADWEAKLRPVCRRLLVIDDLANRYHDCDLLLDQSLRDGNPYADLIPSSAIALLGPAYALLREEFSIERQNCQVRTGEIRRIVVFFGGSDPTGDTKKAVAALIQLPQKIDAEIIVGVMNPARHALEAQCQDHDHLHFACQVSDMAARLAGADLAIGAAGTASWERLCLGVPALLVQQAENQQTNIIQLDKHGVAQALGSSTEVDAKRITDAITTLMAQPETLRAMSVKAWSMVHGDGACRVAGVMLQPEITVRVAGAQDCRAVFDWRNAPEVRRYSHDAHELDFESHQDWYSAVLTQPWRRLLLCDQANTTVGVVRFDQMDTDALVSIYLTPGHLGRNLGAWVLQAAEQWLRGNMPLVSRLVAEVLSDNLPSHKMFLACGYASVGNRYEKRVGHE